VVEGELNALSNVMVGWWVGGVRGARSRENRNETSGRGQGTRSRGRERLSFHHKYLARTETLRSVVRGV
jgi:hypothetical protein